MTSLSGIIDTIPYDGAKNKSFYEEVILRIKSKHKYAIVHIIPYPKYEVFAIFRLPK
jgi:hypothetical protein